LDGQSDIYRHIQNKIASVEETMIQWIFLLVILVGLAILIFMRHKRVEGFGAFKDESMRFANYENNYFQNVADKAVFVNPGLTYSNLNDALASPDLYVPKTAKKDYTPYLMIDPESAFSDKDRKFCRGAVHPRNLPAREKGSAVGCGWYFVEDPDTPSVGVLGTVDGPSFYDLPVGGVWMWDLLAAGEKEDIKACKRVTSCDVIDVEGVKGVCGFCETNGYAVPINGSGQVKYPDSEDGSCGEPTKNTKGACEVPIVQGYMTEDGVDCGTKGRPSPDMTLRLYTKAECDTLGGIHNPDGQCLRSDGGSFSSDCKELNIPPPPPPSICKPNVRGILSRDCLKGIALSLGYSKQGGVMRQLMKQRIELGDTDRDAIKVLQQAGVQVPDSILGTGAISREGAGALYKKLSDTAFKGASSKIKQAAKWFTVGTTEFDVCDYKNTDRGPFMATCAQRAFRTKGCQASGSAYPTEQSAANYASMTWGELNSKFTDLFKSMNSSDPDTQDEATTSCLGLTHTREPPKPCVDFKQTLGIYPESDINTGCFGARSLEDVKAQCRNDPGCSGFSFSKTGNVGNGCFKTYPLVAPRVNGNYDGYEKTPRGLDVINKPNTVSKTWNELSQMCAAKGKRLCSASQMCPSNQPIPDANVFDGKDNWMAVGDKQNQWITYNTAENRLCKVHDQVVPFLPGWGNTTDPVPFFRGAKCCPKSDDTWTDIAVQGRWFMDPQPGARLKTIAVCNDASVFGTNTLDGIWRKPNLNNSSGYSQMPGALTQIDAKSDTLVVGVTSNAGGVIYQWINNDWRRIGERAKWVSIGSDGTIVCVNRDNGSLWRYLGTPQQWENIPGIATQISVGNRDTMWCIGGRNDEIFRWNGSNWQNIPGGLTRVAVSGGGKVAGVNRLGNTFVYSNAINHWRHVPFGELREINISETYIAGTNGGSEIYYLKL